MKKAIAMKCTQEDWDSIKDRIPKKMIYEYFENTLNWSYLTNNFNNDKKIAFTIKDNGFEREIHETFNAKIFLEACGIEMKPTLEEVKEYFKDAEIIESVLGTKFNTIKSIVEREDYIFCFDEKNNERILWHETKGYAKILTYKEQKFEITREQILQLHRQGNHYTKCDLDHLFPDVFKKELETGYYKHKNGEHPKWFCHIDVATGEYYGHNNTGWMSGGVDGRKSMVEYIEENCEPMTPQEVETALIGEAKKIGYKLNDYIEGIYKNRCRISIEDFRFSNNELWFGGCRIFSNGIWATIIETITIQEAEKLLKEQGINKKIV